MENGLKTPELSLSKYMDDKSDIVKIEIEVEEHVSPRSKGVIRGRKRKRKDSDSNSDTDVTLPDNALEVERSVHESAIKNNLDDESVKKILKKVVTNDHVLALVKIREQEEAFQTSPKANEPKLTRAKVKELLKVSPSRAPWSYELTPIKQLPVKTRPEVKALIAHDLPEEEDDDEYDPAHDDVPSDDDQTLESCSDIDSQPRTPATPQTASPRVLRDGPFKVPNVMVATPARRRLIVSESEEEATIALRTRSKINLADTPIEHIENKFIPPDDIPPPRDEEWDQFLSGVFDPSGYREDDDLDDTDPEYNVAADLDANEEDDLDGSILRISKKELNDLVTELFSIMPEAATDELLASNLANNVLTGGKPISGKWEGKQEVITTEESSKDIEKSTQGVKDTIQQPAQLSVGKREIEDEQSSERVTRSQNPGKNGEAVTRMENPPEPSPPPITSVTIEEHSAPVAESQPTLMPPPLLRKLRTKKVDPVIIHVEAEKIEILPEQIQILQQQLRQHIQLCASNFLQLFINPKHWKLAPTYRQYLEQLHKISESSPSSVVSVCNLKPAIDLINGWETAMAEDTPENHEMVEFIQKEGERATARFKHNGAYTGQFAETFKRVVANSNVFLYPYLLPAIPYQNEQYKKYGYRLCEDELLTIGLDQFWRYVESNPQLFKPKKKPNPRTRYGLSATVQLVCKHMFPWISAKLLLSHTLRARKQKGNPVHRFFETGEVVPVKHKLYPFSPELTLYEQPEHEMPRIWVRYLATSSKRFRDHLLKRQHSGLPPANGVPVEFGSKIEVPKKIPLSIDFTKSIPANRCNLVPKTHEEFTDRFDIQIGNLDEKNNENNPNSNGTISQGKRLLVANMQVDINIQSSQANDNTVANITNVYNNVERNKDTENTISKSVITIDGGKISVRNNLSYAERDGVTKMNDTDYARTENTAQNRGSSETKDPNSDKNTQPLIVQNLFKVVSTDTGSYLVPLSVLEASYASNDQVSGQKSTEANNSNILSNNIPNQQDKSKKTSQGDHCKCCYILNKICPEKQTKITDYFKGKVKEKCECSYRKYPKISKRLKLLINNFKSKICCVHKDLLRKLDVVKKESDGTYTPQGAENCDYDLDDIAFVTSFQMKLMNKTNVIRNNYLKKRVNNIFSKFDTEDGDVLKLTESVFKALEVDLIEMYKEFIAFLTPEQAEKIHKFKDYFIQSCVPDLVKRVEKEVTYIDDKKKILTQLSSLFFNNTATSCEMCTKLLYAFADYPTLAKHVFSLFPHRSVMVNDNLKIFNSTNANMKHQIPIQKEREIINVIHRESEVTAPLHNQMNTATVCRDKPPTAGDEEEKQTYVIHYADDASDSDEESQMSVVEDANEQADLDTQDKTLTPSSVNDTNMDSTAFTTKTEIDTEDQRSDTTEMSELIMSEDEFIKSEPPEWHREEDKVILEVLLQNFTPNQQFKKPILDIMEEKNLYDMLAESLTSKSLGNIKERVLYLLQVLDKQ